jgi:hypothetical protein
MARAGVTFQDLEAGGKNGLVQLLESVPSLHIASELVRQREAARETPWTRNDVSDVYALSVAIAYCDVVATELQWVDLAVRSRLDDAYATSLVRNLAGLKPLLSES